jgi:hypothetical protein
MALDQTTLLSVAVSILGVGGGIGLLAFYEQQGERTNERENTQPCTECKDSIVGRGRTVCEVCGGDGLNPLRNSQGGAVVNRASTGIDVDKDGNVITGIAADANENDRCSYCDGAGSIVCLNCSGRAIQPRFLDRLSVDDFMGKIFFSQPCTDVYGLTCVA